MSNSTPSQPTQAAGNYVPKTVSWAAVVVIIGTAAAVLALPQVRILILVVAIVACSPLALGVTDRVSKWRYAYLVSLLALTAVLFAAGSVLVFRSAWLEKASHNSAPTLRIDPVSTTASSSNDIAISGNLKGQIPYGATLWIAVSQPATDEAHEIHYLQPGPCVVDSSGKWKCFPTRVGGPGTWTFTVILADSAATKSFVEDRLSGQRQDDAHSAGLDQRNFFGFPPGTIAVRSLTSPVG